MPSSEDMAKLMRQSAVTEARGVCTTAFPAVLRDGNPTRHQTHIDAPASVTDGQLLQHIQSLPKSRVDIPAREVRVQIMGQELSYIEPRCRILATDRCQGVKELDWRGRCNVCPVPIRILSDVMEHDSNHFYGWYFDESEY